MRKLKLFLLLAVAASSIYSLTACKDKDDDQPNIPAEIIGTWVASAELETIAYTFETSGKFTETYTYQGESESDYGTYTYDGKTLTLKYNDGEVDSYPIVISGNTLTMDGEVYTKK